MSILDSLSPSYNPAEIEAGTYQNWEERGYFKPSLDKDESFSIVLPPPNVTGSLHMGHGFNNAIMSNRSLGLKKLLDNLSSILDNC